MTDIRELEQLALESGAYRDIELDILRETLVSWAERPGDPNSLVELRDGRVLAGFAVFSRVQNTEFTYEVRAICVERLYRGGGVGPRLVELLEEEVLRLAEAAILRFEISKRKEESIGAGFLARAGYALIGHIPAFYEAEDDYYIYAKHLQRPRPEAAPEEASAPGEASPAGAASEAAKAGEAGAPETEPAAGPAQGPA